MNNGRQLAHMERLLKEGSNDSASIVAEAILINLKSENYENPENKIDFFFQKYGAVRKINSDRLYEITYTIQKRPDKRESLVSFCKAEQAEWCIASLMDDKRVLRWDIN